ncbi:MAG: hypothetical protein ABFR36_06105 [Acidobacteriota bacterium]
MFTKTFRTLLLILLFSTLVTSTAFSGEMVQIPGNSTILARYLNFYYNLPSKDFIYHLNDMLIHSEAPTKKLFKRGVRDKLLKIVTMENKIEALIKTRFKYEKNMFTINLSDRKGFRDASKLLNYLGLFLEKKDSGMYAIEEDDSVGIVDYHKFVNLRVKSLEKLVNRTNRLFYNHYNSKMEIPFDFNFLKNCTGLDVNSENFLELMTTNKQFSVLLGILYRLSESDIKYVKELTGKSNAWKQIYGDTKFLLGMFNLSTALRTNNGKLILPGGKEWAPFWSALAGVQFADTGISFLKSIATVDGGKLNYLYSLSFFLPESHLKPLFFNADIKRMRKVYDLITLRKNEDLSDKRFARLRDPEFFSLLYALEISEGKVRFPGDLKDWIKMIGSKVSSLKTERLSSQNDLYFKFIQELLTRKRSNGHPSPISKFVTIYSKFIDRPELINEKTLKLFYEGYDKYNILIDYIEKINILETETIIKLFSWVESISKLHKRDKALFTALYQSVFEILSFSSKHHPNGYNFDRMVTDLIKIPLDKSSFIDNLFKYFNRNMKIPLRKSSLDRKFFGYLLNGVENDLIELYSSDYEIMNKNILSESLNKIIASQEVIHLSTVFEFNDLFNRLPSSEKTTMKSRYNKIVDLFQRLSHPEISDEAPRFIRMRVMSYKRSELNKDLIRLESLITGKNSKGEIKKLVEKFRNKYLFPHLKNFLVTIAYALNAKTERLRIFINPNLVRLHDFEDSEKNTPWNYSGRPDSTLSAKTIPGFRLKGGLSRLNIIFSSVWRDQMLAGNIIFDTTLIESVFTNLFNLYPFAKLKYFPEYASLLINYGVELMDKGKNDPLLKKQLKLEAGKFLAGNTYKNIIDHLDGKTKKPLLFYDQYYKLGRAFLNNKDFFNKYHAKDKLRKYLVLPLKAELNNEKKWFGNIYFRSFGSLKPKWREVFPPETGNLFSSGAFNGEAFREFKMKLSYLSEKKKYPPLLQGHFLYNYLLSTFPRFYQQNYDKDYHTTYFIFNILNNANLSKIIKRYQKKGYVRLR